MIEAIGVPVLLKAIDFLFGEGSKILQERRDRRVKQDDKIPSPSKDSSGSSDDELSKSIITSQETALHQKIRKDSWINYEQEILHLLSLLEIHKQNYYHSKEQYAKWGGALVPPIILHNLTESENEIVNTMKTMKTVLDKVYEKEVFVSHLE